MRDDIALKLLNFENNEIPIEEIPFLIEVFEILGTESVKSTFFKRPIVTILNVLDLIQKHENEIFIDSDIISNSHQLNKDYKCFFPHVTFKFEKSTTEIDFKEIVKNLPKEMALICIDSFK